MLVLFPFFIEVKDIIMIGIMGENMEEWFCNVGEILLLFSVISIFVFAYDLDKHPFENCDISG